MEMTNVGEDVEKATAPSSSKPQATITFKFLKVFLDAKNNKGEEKIILNNVSGVVCPGQMLAIMGPSGSGKTTLLDTLAGRSPRGVTCQGDVFLNGRVSNLSYGISAYVTQHEEFVGVLTVKETLLYAALLRLPSAMNYADKLARVERVLVDIGMVDARDVKIGNFYLKGISGGQRRRLAIGCELIPEPAIMFLDEPTSGLDAASAYHVMNTVRRLAVEEKRTVLTVIHQPSSEVFELFDHLALLSGGRMVYFGKAVDALTMFENVGLPCPPMRSATDHFLHCINLDFTVDAAHAKTIQENAARLFAEFDSKLLPKLMEQVELTSSPAGQPPFEASGNQANPFYQVYVLTERMLVNNWRNLAVFWLRLGMFLGLCICIGTIYFKLGKSWKDTYSRTALLFFTVAFLTFMSISGFPMFVEDMMIFLRERLNGYYSVSAFAIANTVASIPFIFGIAFSSSCVLYWLVGLNDSGDRFPAFFMNLFLALMTVESLMMAIAAIVPHYLMGLAGGAGILGMFMLVCGFFQPVSSIPKPFWRYPLHFLGYHSYSFASFMRNEFEGTSGWECPCVAMANCGPQYAEVACTVDGQVVLDNWFAGSKIGSISKWGDIGIMVLMCVVYRLLFWGMLVLKERANR